MPTSRRSIEYEITMQLSCLKKQHLMSWGGKGVLYVSDKTLQQVHGVVHCSWQASDSVCTKKNKNRVFSWTVHNKLENDLETCNKQTNVMDLTMRTLVTHTNTHTQTQTHTRTHTRCACLCVCICVCACVGGCA